MLKQIKTSVFIFHPLGFWSSFSFCSYNLQMSHKHFTCRQSFWKEDSFKHTFTESIYEAVQNGQIEGCSFLKNR